MRLQAKMGSGEGDAQARRLGGNVVPFLRPQTGSAPVIAGVDRATRPAPLPAPLMSRTQVALFAAMSLALHAGAFAAFQREAPPLASVGVESISVELVLGTDRLAGMSMKPVEAKSTVDAAAAKGEASQLAKLETAPAEVKASEPVQHAKPDMVTEVQPQPRVQAAAVARPVERQQTATLSLLAATTLSPDAAVPLPEAEQSEPEQPRVVAAFPDADVEMPRPRPAPPRGAEKPPEARKATEPPKRKTAVRQKKGEDARVRESTNSLASVASSGIGRGRSDADSNYPGIVQAQLRRNMHFPPYAKRNGQEGRAIVMFSIEPSGNVSNIILAQSTGIASLDREAQAVVRRSSPFPPPPSGRREPFRVPLTFDIRCPPPACQPGTSQ